MIQFLDFQFDEVQTILFKDAQVISLNSTQSKLLALFISKPEKIFSKDDILTEVWQGKVVSEQVVFQNISQLRTIIGDNAIKTFPKKGYQWQPKLTFIGDSKEQQTGAPQETPIVELSNDLEADITLANTRVDTAPLHSSEIKTHKQYTRIIVGCCTLLCLVFGTFYFIDKYEQQGAIKSAFAQPIESQSSVEQTPAVHNDLIYLPFTADSVRHFQEDIDELHLALDFATASDKLDAREFVNSPYMQYQQLNPNDALIFTGILKHNADTSTRKQTPFLLELIVQGPERSWVSYMYGSSMTDLADQVKALMETLASTNYFRLKSESLLSAELALINERVGSSLHVLPLLAYHLIDDDKFDSASGYIELLLTESELKHPLYYAYGKWLKGQLYNGKRDAINAKMYYEQADLLFSDAHIYDLQAEVNKSLAELAHSVAHNKKDFDTIRSHLYKAASLARLGKKPVAEIRAYTLLSIKASKFGMKKARIDYLIQAKTLLAEYQLDGSHYMLPMYHFAIFAETLEERIKFYHAVLDKSVTPENYWVFFSTADNLSKLYLKENKPEEALEVIEKITEPARSALLHAQYYRALNDTDKAINYAKRSFNIGRGQHMNWLSLNSALILLELNQAKGESHELAEYREFIADHATEWWLSWRKDRLANVGIDIEEQMAGL